MVNFKRQTLGPSFFTNGLIIKKSSLGNVEKEFRLCLAIVFIFYFQKLVFGNIKKKNNFLVFLK